MRRVVLGVVVGALGLALIAPTALGSGNPNSGDVWVDNVGQPAGPGHEMDPHLACQNINLWGNGLADSSGTFGIDGWPPSGAQESDYSANWHYSSSGDQVIAVINVAQLIATAKANGDTPQANQGYHFKLQFSQDPQKHKTFWVDCASPSVSTVASGSVPAGGNIYDTATLSGASSPTGTITFKLYKASDTSCSWPLTSVSTSVNGNGSYSSPSVTENTAGTYQWVASYSGDGNNTSATTSCNDPKESVNVHVPSPSPGTPSISTVASGAVGVGGQIFDTAMLSGGSSPTGTISFQLYRASDTSCSSPVGSAVTTSVTHGDGSYASPAITENTPGTYQWLAKYSGDANNLPAITGCNDPSESVVVRVPSPATPSISTVASGDVVAGGQISDTAKLSGGSSPTGTITFRLYRSSDTSCSSPLTSITTSANGDGDYGSPSVTENTAGTYQWVASYSGDANNDAVTASCNAPNESVLVSPPPPAPPLPPGMIVVKAQKLAGSTSGYTTSVITPGVGRLVEYQMSVTNTGGVALAIGFSDARCDPGTVSGPFGTLNPDHTLAPGRTVDYYCSHVITTHDRLAGSFTNTVTITGTPPSGPPLSGTSSVTASVPTVVVKAACTISRGNAQLTGVGGSERKPFVASVGSFGVKQVTFYLDGHKIATVKRPKNGKFSVKINPRHLGVGAHHVKAVIKFSDANCAGLTRAAVFVHPRPAIVVPNFTG